MKCPGNQGREHCGIKDRDHIRFPFFHCDLFSANGNSTQPFKT
jgi:hypothetical protein